MILIKIQTFIRSLLFHVWSGMPKSTTEAIKKRYMICLQCEQFNAIKSECGVCGCFINNKKRFLNKLAWADQKCPINKW